MCIFCERFCKYVPLLRKKNRSYKRETVSSISRKIRDVTFIFENFVKKIEKIRMDSEKSMNSFEIQRGQSSQFFIGQLFFFLNFLYNFASSLKKP